MRKSKNKSKRESGEKKNSRQLVAKAEAASQKRPRISSPDVALTLKHFNRRIEKSRNLGEGKRLYLRVGDEVNHLRYEEWGIGVVTEVMTSSIPGGTCLARVRFQDGQLRCFNNDLENFWDWIGSPAYPLRPATEAFRMGANFVVYSMTH